MSYAPQANVNIHLSRINGQIPWGFRMAGGSDYSGPLSIQRVTPGTIASNCGVQPGDLIVQINGVHTGMMKHADAQQAIIQSGNNVTLGLSRGPASGKDPSPIPQKPSYPAIPAPNEYKWRKGNPPPSPGHGDAYQAPGLAYQSHTESLIVPGYAPDCPDVPLVRYTNSDGLDTVVSVNIARGTRSRAVGSYTPPSFSSRPGPAPASVSPMNNYAPAPRAQPSYNPPVSTAKPAPTTTNYPFARPATSPGKGWVPEGGSTSNMQVGDLTAQRGKSTYYNAPLDPSKIPICSDCNVAIRGPFIVALNKCWCPHHFTCSKCKAQLIDMGFVEMHGQICCEKDYEIHFAPKCAKCEKSIMGDTVNALKKTWHKTCFICVECSNPISTGAFHVEDGRPYCINDWQRLFQTKCAGCEFPVEPGDRWIEALDTNWHSECFVCNVCNTPLEGKAFFAREGRPYCKGHAGAIAR